mmetsp:Transcript_2118/g.6410  ORF Transcript_2118/g.6410 Transcript_2118/m.6410 type:complete len:322 (-) Transcript_2118:143-1108(-)|eukprot:CAMPEP_0118863766 /NCGR_PEP_ID=MMETSP1163-20130328/8518_1 /TAXON_ID=124430 /ORGANISM="Phaeomonas parva, Strain CCMP2877" /LENGTH=321 /DNA_ID=CAMNT_0006797799 /DNA_START=30 /DNA_END=995 /DNA_ORIENTATION=-
MGAAAEPRPSPLRVWVLATRPNTLTASLSPILVGAAAAWRLGYRALGLAAVWWAFAGFCQIGTNLHNDYADFVKGADTEDRKGQARATQKGWLTPAAVRSAAAACVAVQVAIGLHLALTETPPGSDARTYMYFVTVTSAFNAFAYTGGEWPLGLLGLGWVSLGYAGLGDLFVFLYFGGVATVTPYVLQTHAVPPPLLLALAAMVGCLATSIIVVNNLRDRNEDVRAGKRTLTVRFGATFARTEYTALVLLPYAALAAFAYGFRAEVNPAAWAPPALTLPLAFRNVAAIWRTDGAALNPYVGKSALAELAFCGLLAAGLVCA